MITNSNWLYPAYVFNIIILVPVVYAMLLGSGVANVFQGTVVESSGLRLMVGSLWFAILVASVAGLIWPSYFSPLLIVQVIYKSVWLVLFVLPLWRAGETVPAGITMSFIIIVVTYPILLWLATRTSLNS